MVVFFMLFCVIALRLFFVQILYPANTSDYLKTKKIYPQRGKIYDRNMLLFATNQTKYRIFAEPKKIQNHHSTINDIASLLHMETSTIEARFDRSKDWVSLATGLNRGQVEELIKKRIFGVGFEEMQSRYYPEGSASAHVLGFVGRNKESDNVGYFGIEGYYDKDLSGLPGLIRSDRDLLNQPIFLGTQEKTDSENGRDLVLTIDKSVQNIVKSKLKEGMELYQAKQGCVIVADPYTLEILGLSCLPDYDPEKYFDNSDQVFKNSSISDLYEPGSTFKPLIMAGALEKKAVTLANTYNEKGPVVIGEYTIKTWNNSYEGVINMTRILEKSSNVGMVHIGEKLKPQGLVDLIRSFRFGKLTEIDLQGEVSGYIKPFQDWYQIDFATATFGQGIVVTPIQMIRAFATLINGGYLMKPFVVKQLIGEKSTISVKPEVVTKLLSDRTSEIMKTMLQSTIENGETKRLKPNGYSIGGKTGTAQIAIQGRYDASKTIASFVGFAPVKKPKFIALVILYEPKSSQWGSETAAPIFFNIAKDLIVYYNIPPQ